MVLGDCIEGTFFLKWQDLMQLPDKKSYEPGTFSVKFGPVLELFKKK